MFVYPSSSTLETKLLYHRLGNVTAYNSSFYDMLSHGPDYILSFTYWQVSKAHCHLVSELHSYKACSTMYTTLT